MVSGIRSQSSVGVVVGLNKVGERIIGLVLRFQTSKPFVNG